MQVQRCEIEMFGKSQGNKECEKVDNKDENIGRKRKKITKTYVRRYEIKWIRSSKGDRKVCGKERVKGKTK